MIVSQSRPLNVCRQTAIAVICIIGLWCPVNGADSLSRTEKSYRVPAVELLDHAGESINLKSFLDTQHRWLLVNFVFTTCNTICPVMSAQFAWLDQHRERFAKPFTLISISIDPDFDTPDVLRRYAQQWNASDDWYFLSGDRASIIALQKAFDHYHGSKMAHGPLTLLRAPDSHHWIRLQGPARLADIAAELGRTLTATDTTPNTQHDAYTEHCARREPSHDPLSPRETRCQTRQTP